MATDTLLECCGAPPASPELGAVYADVASRSTKIYTSEGWLTLESTHKAPSKHTEECKCGYCGRLRQDKFSNCPSCGAAGVIQVKKEGPLCKTFTTYIGDGLKKDFKICHQLGHFVKVNCIDTRTGELVIPFYAFQLGYLDVIFEYPPLPNQFQLFLESLQ